MEDRGILSNLAGHAEQCVLRWSGYTDGMEKDSLVNNGGRHEMCEHERKTTDGMGKCSEDCTDYKGSNSAAGQSDCV